LITHIGFAIMLIVSGALEDEYRLVLRQYCKGLKTKEKQMFECERSACASAPQCVDDQMAKQNSLA